LLLWTDSINARLVQYDLHARLHTHSDDVRKKTNEEKEMNDFLFPFLFRALKNLFVIVDKRKRRREIYKRTFLIFYEIWRSLVVSLFHCSSFFWCVSKCWSDRDDTDVVYLMYIFITLTYAISSLHLLLALISIIVGIISQSRSPVWMAYSVSPIWSGVFVSSIDD
jgi:hypothetical protein